MNENIVLINPNDEVLGQMEKITAHVNGLLHRAFSVFLLDKQGRMLLQKRSSGKYHSPNLWTNACCSHPRIGETYLQAAQRRLIEELGIHCELEKKFHFIYKADVGGGLWEHELDHVFVGHYQGDILLNPNEVSAVKYVHPNELKDLIESQPEQFTAWFHIIWNEYQNQLMLI